MLYFALLALFTKGLNHALGGGGAVQSVTPEMFWRLFESTGSIWAYLAYRKFAPMGKVLLLTISPN